MKKVKNFNLELTFHELIILEANLETKVENLKRLGLHCEREKALLRKIYAISPTTDYRIEL